jgi:hypothetical protein
MWEAVLLIATHKASSLKEDIFDPSIVVWERVAMDFLKYHSGPPYLTFLHRAIGPPLERPYSRFRSGLTAGWAAFALFLSSWTPHAVRLCYLFGPSINLQARTGRGIHGLPKVSPGPAMPNPAAVFFPLGYPFLYGPVNLPWYTV